MTSGHTTQVGQQEERKKVPANRLIRTHNDGSCDGTHQLGEQFYRMGQLQSPGFSDFLRILNVLPSTHRDLGQVHRHTGLYACCIKGASER